MKKLLLSFSALLFIGGAVAQQDTLSNHLAGPVTIYVADGEEPLDSGYITGTNAYGDKAKLQKFDALNGVGSGTISGVALAIPIKAGTAAYQVGIWADNAGVPAAGLPLAIANTTLAATDTSAAAFGVINGTSLYNHVVMFASPIAIPAGNTFWVGVVLPTTGEMAILSNNAGTAPYAASATHTGEIWSDNTFHTLPAAWGANLSMGIYPIVNITSAVGLSENVIETSVYPNPANSVLNVSSSEEIVNISVKTMDGKIVASSATSSVDVASLTAGIYIYSVTTVSGKTSNGTFAKN